MVLLRKKLLLSPFYFLLHLYFDKSFLFFKCPLNFQFFFLCLSQPKQSSNKSISKKYLFFFELYLFFGEGHILNKKIKNYHLISSKIKTGSCNKPSFLYSHALTIACGIQLSLISAAARLVHEAISFFFFCSFLNKQVLMLRTKCSLNFFL